MHWSVNGDENEFVFISFLQIKMMEKLQLKSIFVGELYQSQILLEGV